MDAGLGTGTDRTLVHQRLLDEGLHARACVTGLRAIGPSSAQPREVELDLHVQLDGVGYDVTHRQEVSGTAMAGLHVGTELPVLVDPGDPKVLVIA